MKTRIAAGNWKMTPSSAQAALEAIDYLKNELTYQYENRKCIIFPPTCFIGLVAEAVKDTCIEVGAQLISDKLGGRYTGQCSAPQVQSLGAKWVMVGHNEVKKYLYNDTERFKNEITAALSCGLKVIYCVGEDENQLDRLPIETILEEQLASVFKDLDPHELENIVIAYTPIEIVKGREAEKIRIFIEEWIYRNFGNIVEKVSICYGGTVDNSGTLDTISQSPFDGAIVNGSPLQPNNMNILETIYRE